MQAIHSLLQLHSSTLVAQERKDSMAMNTDGCVLVKLYKDRQWATFDPLDLSANTCTNDCAFLFLFFSNPLHNGPYTSNIWSGSNFFKIPSIGPGKAMVDSSRVASPLL